MSPPAKRTRSTKSSRSSQTLEVPLPRPPENDDPETLEFLKAIDRFKRTTGRNFPTWTEVLQIVHSLGYRKTEPANDPN